MLEKDAVNSHRGTKTRKAFEQQQQQQELKTTSCSHDKVVLGIAFFHLRGKGWTEERFTFA